MINRPEEPDEAGTLAIAARLHAGQTDWGGNPYIGHLIAVRDLLGQDATEVERKAALLHDTIEDVRMPDGTPEGRPMVPDDLRALGFRDEIVEIVVLLSRPPEPKGWWRGMSRDAALAEGDRRYFRKIDELVASGNLSAMRVKLADNTHNGDPSRDQALSDPRHLERSRRFRDRYGRSADILREAIAVARPVPSAPVG